MICANFKLLGEKKMKRITSRYKKSLVFLLLCASAFVALPFIKVSASGTITGRVFQDYNGNGIYDNPTTNPAVDVGVGGVTVTVFDSAGTVRGTATTCRGLNNPTSYCTGINNGMYSISAAGTGPYRVEFTTLPAGYFSSARSTDSVDSGTTNGSGTTVQFVRDGNNELVNLAVNHPDDYCQNNPDICVNQYVNGDNEKDLSINSGIWRIPYATAAGNANNQNPIANKDQVGSTWGLAYSKTRKRLYSAAFLKRHVGLEGATNGDGGNLGAIYSSVIAPNFSSQNATTAPTLLTTIPSVGTPPTSRGLGLPTGTSADPNAFASVGKIGLGDIEMSQDESLLYAVNLNNKKLYSFNISSGAMLDYTIPNPSCVGGEWRPFALGRYRNTMYVGGVCDASASGSAANLRAIVYSFNTPTFTKVLDVPLNYSKGKPYSGCSQKGWYAWTDSVQPMPGCNYYVYPQPILSDLEFDNDGSMILGFIDRSGHQFGRYNLHPTNGTTLYNMVGGDILRAGKNTSGTFTLENNASVSGITTGGANLGQGPGNGEFYYEDSYLASHEETSEGGLAMMPGAKDIVLTSMDPNNIVGVSGVSWLNNTTGKKTKGYSVFTDTNATFGKANGVGDVELLCDLAPIEIGNRVWNDLDGDGVQDGGEPGIAGVTVSLYNSSNVAIATAVTNSSGEYYFSSATVSGIEPNKSYQIRLDNSVNYTGILSSFSVTIPNATTDSIDSDALNVTNPIGSPSTGIFPVISLTTGVAGANDHTFDVGFKPKPLSEYNPTASVDCGMEGKICIDYRVPGTPAAVGNVRITLQRYQNGVPVGAPIQVGPFNSGNQYCFPASQLLAGITGDFDWSAVVTYQLPGVTIQPTIIGRQGVGYVEGQNNDFKQNCKNCCGIGKNLVRNGDFNRREETFESIYRANSELFPSQFWIGNSEDARNACRNWEINGHSKCDDPKDNFLMVNGRTTQIGATPAVVWSQKVPVEGGSEYEFCAFFKDLKQCCFNKQPEITMKATINGSVITQNATISTENKRCDWQLVSTKINVPAGVSSINLEILLNENVNGDGNDVAIDDISLTKKPNLPNNETQFLWSQQTYTDDSHYTVLATPTKTQKPDCKYTWTAVELDASNAPILSTRRTWTIPPANTGAFAFGGFPGASGTSPGIFDVGKTYEFTYRAECDCSNPQTTVQRHFVGFPTNNMVKPTKGTPVPKNLIRISEVRQDRNPTN